MDFVSSLVQGAGTFVGTTLSGATIVASTIVSSTLSGATIVNGTFSGTANITGGTISGTTIRYTDISRHQMIRVHRGGAGQTISNTTNTKVQHDTENNDPDGVYDNATNYRLTPTVSGTFLVTAAAGFTSMLSGDLVRSRIYKNGSLEREASVESAGSNISAVAVGLVIVNGSTDYIEHYVFQDSGGNLDMDNTEATTFMHAMWVDQ